MESWKDLLPLLKQKICKIVCKLFSIKQCQCACKKENK
jgi:hypothetical protein